MGAYKRDVVVVIKMGAYIHGVLVGAYYPDFTEQARAAAHILRRNALIQSCAWTHPVCCPKFKKLSEPKNKGR